jgi:hypothetical protein
MDQLNRNSERTPRSVLRGSQSDLYIGNIFYGVASQAAGRLQLTRSDIDINSIKGTIL